jgi:hypothetical protein
MTVRMPTVVRNALLSTIASRADAGSGPGQLRVYSGPQPVSANDAATGTLLITFTLPKPAFSVPANGNMSFANIPPIVGTATADGTVGWARLVDSTGATVLDGSVGTAGADFIITTSSVIVGHSVVLSATLALG